MIATWWTKSDPPGTRMVELHEVSRSNWLECARLQLKPQQENLVAANVYSIAEWHFEPHYIPRAICVRGQIVGFLMYCVETDPPDPHLYWLFRFMIAAEHQGKGYGSAALQSVIAEMKDAGAKRIRTGHKPENAVASRLYQSAGFVAIGLLDDGDVGLELCLSTPNGVIGD